MVYRVFVEKKKELAHEARNLLEDLRSLLHIEALASSFERKWVNIRCRRSLYGSM